jgi:hypothetical protein
MPAVRGNFEALITPGAKKAYMDEYNELPAIYPSLLNVETSSQAFEDDLVLTGLPIAVSRAEGTPIPMDRPVFRGRVRYIHTGYGLGYEITREAVEDDLYGKISKPGSQNLARSMREAEEVSAHGLFNNAFTTVQAYDGVSLLNTAHPGVGLNVTFANRPVAAVDLSVPALQASLERFMLLRNDRSLRINMMPTTLLVSVFDWWLAREILESKFEPTTNLNRVNVVEGILTPVKSPYLTDPDAWFVMAPKGVHKLKMYWRRKPDPVSGFDGRNEVSWFGITARWSNGATDWRGIDGSEGV